MRIEIRRLKISESISDSVHGFTHDQDYVVFEDEGQRFVVTHYQGGWLLANPDFVAKGELIYAWEWQTGTSDYERIAPFIVKD